MLLGPSHHIFKCNERDTSEDRQDEKENTKIKLLIVNNFLPNRNSNEWKEYQSDCHVWVQVSTCSHDAIQATAGT